MNRVTLPVAITEGQYARLQERGNMAGYLLNLMFTHIDEYGPLRSQSQIVNGEKRTKQVAMTLNAGMFQKLKTKAESHGLPWQEYGRRLALQILQDSELRQTSTHVDTSKLIDAIDEYLQNEKDEEITLQAEVLKELVQKKEQKNRYKRLIPEIQKLLMNGVTLDDVIATAEAMGESKCTA